MFEADCVFITTGPALYEEEAVVTGQNILCESDVEG